MEHVSGNTMNEQKQQDQTLGLLFFCCVFIFLIWIIFQTASWMLDIKRMPLSQVAIQGELQHVEARDVQNALIGIPNMGTFMVQDINELQTSINSIPWVARASIRKQWPNTIKVYLVEHTPSAVWNGNALLNEQGDVFQAPFDNIVNDTIQLYGPDKSSHLVLDVYRQLAEQLKTHELMISSIVLNERRAWQVILENGTRLELGKGDPLKRIDTFFMLYKELGDQFNKVSYIDLRYDTGAAVGWLPEQS